MDLEAQDEADRNAAGCARAGCITVLVGLVLWIAAFWALIRWARA